MFSEFLTNLIIKNKEQISSRYAEITSALNKQFRETESKTHNTLQVGSFGRKTGINGISDLDMIYIIPKNKWHIYKNNQSRLLKDTKDAILARYPKTNVKVDRLVVTVTYQNFYIEVQPVFQQDDGSFKYPDTYKGGSWKVTKPREEIAIISEMDEKQNGKLRTLCKMRRAWKNHHGIAIGGLLIDTLIYNFFKGLNDKQYSSYIELCRDFFEYLSKLPKQSKYAAPGSNQDVKVKQYFQHKAKIAYDLCINAINAKGQANENSKWKKIFGRPFPQRRGVSLESCNFQNWKDTEEFIDNLFPIDIKENLKIECEVTQDGFRKNLLTIMLKDNIPLRVKKNLKFYITEISVQEPYDIHWKVLNRGEEAKKRNCIRGQIIKDKGHKTIQENTEFNGNHIVECYCVKNNIVIAKDTIKVPIAGGDND